MDTRAAPGHIARVAARQGTLLLPLRRQAHQEQNEPGYPAKGSLAVSLVRVSTPTDTMTCIAAGVQPCCGGVRFTRGARFADE